MYHQSERFVSESLTLVLRPRLLRSSTYTMLKNGHSFLPYSAYFRAPGQDIREELIREESEPVQYEVIIQIIYCPS